MLALVNAEAEDVDLKNCALGGSIILSTGGSTFVSAEAYDATTPPVHSLLEAVSDPALTLVPPLHGDYAHHLGESSPHAASESVSR